MNDSLDFRVEHSVEPLEEPLPLLAEKDTLVSRWDPRSPLSDLIKGFSVGVAAAAIPLLVMDQNKINPNDKSRWTMQWSVATGVGLGAGLFAFSYRRSHLAKPEAVAENLRRQQKRLEFNQGVARRNADRLDKTKLIITPR